MRSKLLMMIAALATAACGINQRIAGSKAVLTGGSSQACSIDGNTFAIGEANPDNGCQVCAPSDAAEWSPAAEGMVCAPNHTCHRGHCWRVLSAADQYRRRVATLFDGTPRPTGRADASISAR